jgi:hypothetical protein
MALPLAVPALIDKRAELAGDIRSLDPMSLSQRGVARL